MDELHQSFVLAQTAIEANTTAAERDGSNTASHESFRKWTIGSTQLFVVDASHRLISTAPNIISRRTQETQTNCI